MSFRGDIGEGQEGGGGEEMQSCTRRHHHPGGGAACSQHGRAGAGGLCDGSSSPPHRRYDAETPPGRRRGDVGGSNGDDNDRASKQEKTGTPTTSPHGGIARTKDIAKISRRLLVYAACFVVIGMYFVFSLVHGNRDAQPFIRFYASSTTTTQRRMSFMSWARGLGEKPAPSVFIVGMQKCGTTTLGRYLRRYKDLVWPVALDNEPAHYRKELHFFDMPKNFEKGVAFYNSHFLFSDDEDDASLAASATNNNSKKKHAMYIEATPYMSSMRAVHNMKEVYGEEAFSRLKFIVILKDPVERHISWWSHMVENKSEESGRVERQTSRGKAMVSGRELNADTERLIRLARETGDHEHDDDAEAAQCGMLYCVNPLLLGAYARMIKDWLDAGVHPRQLEVIFLDEFVHDTAETMHRVTEFLGINAVVQDTVTGSDNEEPENVNRHSTDDILTPETKAALSNYYAPWNCRLAVLLETTGIRMWDDARASAGAWFPTREACVAIDADRDDGDKKDVHTSSSFANLADEAYGKQPVDIPVYTPKIHQPRPSLFLLGMQKCGTSSLSTLLKLHPDLVWPSRFRDEPPYYNKELHFFDTKHRYVKGIEFYNAHFRRKRAGHGGKTHAIEATPYLHYSLVARRMKESYGDDFHKLKFVVILKDPTARHESFWNHMTQDNWIKSTDLNADVAQNIADYTKGADLRYGAMCLKESVECLFTLQDQYPLFFGAYAFWIQLWLDVGALPEQFEIIFFQEYTEAPAEILQRVYRFYGLRDPGSAGSTTGRGGVHGVVSDIISRAKNASKEAPKSNVHEHKQELTPENRDAVNRYYAPWNCRLAELLHVNNMRSWEDARAGAGSWFPTRDECAQYEIGLDVDEADDVVSERSPRILPKTRAFVFGTGNAGTASFWSSLAHPDLVSAQETRADRPYYYGRELVFFESFNQYVMGIGYYNSHYWLPLPSERSMYVDGTPYVQNPEAARRMKMSYGDEFTKLKFVVVLRNPIQQHVSWWNARHQGLSGLNEAVDSFFNSEVERDMYDFVASCISSECIAHHPMVMGAYAHMLQFYFDAGARPEQFLIMFIDEFVAGDGAGNAAVDRIVEFLGVDTAASDGQWADGGRGMLFESEAADVIKDAYVRELTPENHGAMELFYMPWNCRLAELLDMTGMRAWDDASAAAGTWYPSREDCRTSNQDFGWSRELPKPRAFVLGVASCGVSGLERALKGHPDLVWPAALNGESETGGSGRKLAFFSSKDFVKGIEFYNDRFADSFSSEHAQYIEMSVYLNDVVAMKRMKDTYGDTFSRLKFVVFLASPTQMQRALWWRDVGSQRVDDYPRNLNEDVEKYLSIDFETSIETLFEECLEDEFQPEGAERKCALEDADSHPLFVGAYVYSLQRWIHAGVDPQQLEVVFLDEYVRDAERVLQRITGFLGVAGATLTSARTDDGGGGGGDNAADLKSECTFSKDENGQDGDGPEPLTPENEAALNRFYAPWNCMLAEFLDVKGIRTWEKARAAAGAWYPMRGECARLHASTKSTNNNAFLPSFGYDKRRLPKPSAFILGMQQSGAMRLSTSLARNPDLSWPVATHDEPPHFAREQNFFNYVRRYDRGVDFYNGHFVEPLRSEKARYIEATSSYFHLADAARRMKVAYGDAFASLKFVVILTDPTQRHVSWWNYFVQAGTLASVSLNDDITREYIPTEAAMNVDEQVASCGGETCYLRNPLLLGVYVRMFQTWLQLGARPEQFEVIFLDEYTHDTDGVLRRVTDFLGIRETPPSFSPFSGVDTDEGVESGEGVHNIGDGSFEHVKELTPANLHMLNRFYAPWNCRLAEFLDSSGIRAWEDARRAAGAWYPMRDECLSHLANSPPLFLSTSIDTRS